MIRAPHASLSGWFICLLFAGFMQLPGVLMDPDVGWHLAAGDVIRAQLSVPDHDPFAHTTGEARWFNISWGWDVAMSMLQSLTGLYGVSVFAVLIYALVPALLLWHARRQGALLLPAILLLVAALPGLMVTLSVRPHQLSVLLLPVALLLLHGRRQGQIGLPVYLALSFCLMVIWVNMHGGFLAFFTVLGAYGLEALWRRDRREFIALAVTSAVSIAALCINPLGVGVLEACWQTLGGQMVHNITEWRALGFTSTDSGTLIYPMLMLVLAVPLWPHMRPADRLLAAFWLICACSSQRHLPVFIVISFVPVAVALSVAVQQGAGRWARLLVRKSDEYEHDLGCTPARRVMLALAIVFALGAPWLFRQTLYPDGITFPEDKMPAAEIEALKPYACLKLLNHYNLGGWIIYQTRGAMPVFIDGRAETAYPDSVVTDYLDFMALSERMPEVLTKYDIELVMVPVTSQPIIRYLTADPGWREVLRGEVAVAFLREDFGPDACATNLFSHVQY